jgi:TRAP transporter TAXI family solute receptor
MSQKIRKTLTFGLVAGAVALATTPASAQGILKGDTGGVGSVNHTFMIIMSTVLQKKIGVNLQVNEGQTLTKSTLKLGQGKIDVSVVPPVMVPWMHKGTRFYKKRPGAAKKAINNIRLIMAYGSGVRHYLVWADSGIKTWADIKGKRIFVGPPRGGASPVAIQSIKLNSGLVNKKDYKEIRMPWNAGIQAMSDGKLDVFVRPAGVGAASIDQLGAKRKFRLLAINPNAPGMKKFIANGGRQIVRIPAGTYNNQIDNNKDVVTDGFRHQLAVRKEMSDDLVYRITKTIFDNLPEMQKSAVTLRDISLKDPFTAGNIPLHPGAIRFYKEVGKKIPANLVPGN